MHTRVFSMLLKKHSYGDHTQLQGYRSVLSIL